MATTKQLSDLFRSIALEDLASAAEKAEAICSNAEKKGHLNVAKTLRGALEASSNGFSNQNIGTSLQLAFPIDPWRDGLEKLSDTISLDQVFLTASTRKSVQEVISEYKLKSELEKNNIQPRSKLIFHGHSGCGKSMTAKAIAHELQLPIFMLRFDEIIGAYLGQTASKLRRIFQFIDNKPCVLLLDEVDAIGRHRGDSRDVGELDRIVISLMQELEHSNSKGLIIATTNIPKDLDRALWRRFDLNIEFRKPNTTQIRKFAKKVADDRKAILSKSLASGLNKIDNYAACENYIIDDLRRKIISKAKDNHGKEKEV